MDGVLHHTDDHRHGLRAIRIGREIFADLPREGTCGGATCANPTQASGGFSGIKPCGRLIKIVDGAS